MGRMSLLEYLRNIDVGGNFVVVLRQDRSRKNGGTKRLCMKWEAEERTDILLLRVKGKSLGMKRTSQCRVNNGHESYMQGIGDEWKWTGLFLDLTRRRYIDIYWV